MSDLFSHCDTETILLDGSLLFYPNFIVASEANSYYEQLLSEVEWQADEIKLFGKSIPIPRLQAWYGDLGLSYTYSGLKMQPKSWTNTLSVLKARVEEKIKSPFNSVLCNRYRDGKDSMSWHSDDEKELGSEPVIASLNFGASRTFQLRAKDWKTSEKKKVVLQLNPGSLLVMRKNCQRDWQHAVPKTAKSVGERINLTFRKIIS